MPDRRALDKQRTRERISTVATTLFLDRGFDRVTVAEVASAAGVSKVTVFAHFARKEDLLLDRAPEAAALLREAVIGRAPGTDAVEALRALAVELAEQRHPFSGLRAGTRPFLATVAGSPALLDRMREQLGELEDGLAAALAGPPHPAPAPRLLAALVVAAYRTVVAATVRQIVDGRPPAAVAPDHRRRLDEACDAVAAAAASLVL